MITGRKVPVAAPAVSVVLLALALSSCGGPSGENTTPSSTTPAPATTSATGVPETGTPTTTTRTMPGFPEIPIVPGSSGAILGSWRDPDGGAVVTFADDGTLTGTDGCNVFQSTWTLTVASSDGGTGQGAVITIAPFPTTMMACTGPWSPWVLSMETVRHDGEHLLALNAGVEDGVEIGRLIPAVPA